MKNLPGYRSRRGFMPESAAGSGTASGAGTGGAGSECEGEDQDDSSSSDSHEALDVAVGNLTLQDDSPDKDNEALQAFRHEWQRELDVSPSPQEEPQRLLETEEATEKKDDTEDELSTFRVQWQRELEGTPSPQRTPPKPVEEPQTEEERAKQLFLRGIEYERGGKLYEAIQQYKRAMQILPDVETRLYESSELSTETPEAGSESEETVRVEPAQEEDEDFIDGEDLVTRLRRLLSKKGTLFEQEFPAKGAHISWLPYEVILLVVRWVVSSELDAVSLERVAATSRALYVAAREPDLWRALCVRTWGRECAQGFPSWRLMFVERPRVHLHGCYISKTTYLRPGEHSFQDHFYRPWYLVDYYRYLRFFPEGLVLMWTTAEEPAVSVAQLKSRSPRAGLGIMLGHYRLQGDKVMIMIKKSSGEKKPAQTAHTRFRARRKEAPDSHELLFHLELELRKVRSRRNFQLSWVRYAALSRRDQWTNFELSASKFPPFAFSRVRQYCGEARAPLPRSHACA